MTQLSITSALNSGQQFLFVSETGTPLAGHGQENDAAGHIKDDAGRENYSSVLGKREKILWEKKLRGRAKLLQGRKEKMLQDINKMLQDKEKILRDKENKLQD